MDKLKIIENNIYSPEQIVYGVRLGKNRGNSTITDVYIKSDSMEEQEICFRIYGIVEREGLSKIFKELSDTLKNDSN